MVLQTAAILESSFISPQGGHFERAFQRWQKFPSLMQLHLSWKQKEQCLHQGSTCQNEFLQDDLDRSLSTSTLRRQVATLRSTLGAVGGNEVLSHPHAMKYVAGLHQPIGWLGQAGGVVWCWRWQQQGAQCSLLPPGLPLLNSPPQMLNNFSTFQTLSYHGESVQLELTSTTLCRTEMRSISAIFSALHAVLSILLFWHL